MLTAWAYSEIVLCATSIIIIIMIKHKFSVQILLFMWANSVDQSVDLRGVHVCMFSRPQTQSLSGKQFKNKNKTKK